MDIQHGFPIPRMQYARPTMPQPHACAGINPALTLQPFEALFLVSGLSTELFWNAEDQFGTLAVGDQPQDHAQQSVCFSYGRLGPGTTVHKLSAFAMV